MKTQYISEYRGKIYKVTIWEIILYILSFFVLLYLFINIFDGREKRNRLKTEGICTIVTVTKVFKYNGKGGISNRVSYLVSDTIVNSSVGSMYRLRVNRKYWARYLPDDPQIIELLTDEKYTHHLPVGDPLEMPSICNCQNEETEIRSSDIEEE